MTASGYPRIVKEWQRGTPLDTAKVVYEGKADDMYIAAFHDDTPGFERDFVSRTLAFYNDELYLRGKDGKLVKIDAPNSANKSVHKDWLLLELRDAYAAGGKTYAAGSLIAANFDDFMAGKREFTTLFAPTERTSLASYAWTRNHLVVNVLEDVKNRISVLTPAAGEWKREAFVGAPTIGTVSVGAVDADESDAVWMTATDYLTPTTLALAQLGQAARSAEDQAGVLRRQPGVVEQHFATSKDGTQRAVLPGQAEEPQARRHRADAAVRLRRLRDLADPGRIPAASARAGWRRAACTRSPISAAAANTARAGTRPRSRPTATRRTRISPRSRRT